MVLHLGVVAGVEAEFSEPGQPSLRVDEPADLRLDVERAGVLLPGPAQERLEPPGVLVELRVRRDGAVVDDRPARGPLLLPPLRRHDVLLVVHASPHLDEAVLQHHLRVAEDEVDGAADDAVAVVLPARVRVQRVLVPVELALVERRHVALHPQRHGLVVLGPRRVLHPDAAHQEPVPDGLHRGRVLGGDVHHEALAARDDGLGLAVPDDGQVRHVPRDRHVLPVRAGLDVHHVGRGALAWHLGQRLVDGLEVPAAVRGHRDVGLEPGHAGGLQQQPAFRVGEPLGRGAEEPPAEAAQVEPGQRLGEGVDDGEDVLGELLRAVQRLAHLVRGVGGGVLEPVQARVLVREGGAEPRPEVVHGALEVGHLEPAQTVEGRLQVVDGVVQELLAVFQRARGALVVLQVVEHGGLAHGLRDPVRGRLEDGLGKLRGARRVARRLLQRALARLAVVHGLAERLDRLHRRRKLAALPIIIAAAAVVLEGDHADRGHDGHHQHGRRAHDGAFPAHNGDDPANTSMHNTSTDATEREMCVYEMGICWVKLRR
ncbi:hypothetical protein PR202_gb19584 [Eleusine coracana subsp. coracana]|uniref:Uncharacterized protein n=1 Tax=Eleusine coracana subsp. coracana TaxID=191504 RepID=A0AAV5F8M4_ELECO|nr:hypothetical protein PR202_gb19584 [Eleusine coracana subsp. coracana]